MKPSSSSHNQHCQPMLFFCSNHNRHVWSQSRLSKNDFARSYFQIENPLDKKNWRLGAKITFCALLKDSWRKLCLLGRVVFPISRLNQKSNVLRPPEKYVFALLRYNLLHLFFVKLQVANFSFSACLPSFLSNFFFPPSKPVEMRIANINAAIIQIQNGITFMFSFVFVNISILNYAMYNACNRNLRHSIQNKIR